MINNNLNTEKGITIVSLVITIVIILILSGTIIYNMSSSSEVSQYNKMIADIELLEDKIKIYFNKYGEAPKILNRKITINSKDYYEIDLSKLDTITLNYGKEHGKNNQLINNDSDVYVVNNFLEVYYLKGISLSEEKRHEN